MLALQCRGWVCSYTHRHGAGSSHHPQWAQCSAQDVRVHTLAYTCTLTHYNHHLNNLASALLVCWCPFNNCSAHLLSSLFFSHPFPGEESTLPEQLSARQRWSTASTNMASCSPWNKGWPPKRCHPASTVKHEFALDGSHIYPNWS